MACPVDLAVSLVGTHHVAFVVRSPIIPENTKILDYKIINAHDKISVMGSIRIVD